MYEEGLKRLKNDKESMLEKFQQDNGLGWLAELGQTHDVVQSDAVEVVTKELNFYQMKKVLGLDHLKDDDEFVKCEVARFESVVHPNEVWAAAGERLFFYNENQSRSAHATENRLTMKAVAKTAPKPKEKPAPGEAKVNWQVATKRTAAQVDKLTKDLEKQLSKTRRLKSSVSKLQLADLKEVLQIAEDDMSDKVQLLLVTCFVFSSLFSFFSPFILGLILLMNFDFACILLACRFASIDFEFNYYPQLFSRTSSNPTLMTKMVERLWWMPARKVTHF